MKEWLIKCASGREFVVYARDKDEASARFRDCRVVDRAGNPEERLSTTEGVSPVGPVIDNRRAPGA